MVSWSFALVFSDLSALRQVNAQHIQFLCEITARNQPYLVSQHVNGKSRDKAPSLVVTPLIDLHGSREWFDKGRKLLWRDADLLWAAASGDPLCRHSTLRRCPLTDGEIQKAFQLVLTQACGMAAHEAQQYTKHSARKLVVSHERGGRPPQARPRDHEHAEALLSQRPPHAGRQDLRQPSPADELLPERSRAAREHAHTSPHRRAAECDHTQPRRA